jgi:hypothetical protein
MGQMRFVVSPPDRMTEEVLHHAYMSGMDRTPWVVEIENIDAELVLEREVGDSASATIPWHVPGHGLLALSTGTLVERWDPYKLPLELARGVLNQFRQHFSEWYAIGLTVPEDVYALLRQATDKLSWAVVRDDEEGTHFAEEALRLALDGSRRLAAVYAEQAIAVRRRATGRLPSLLAAELLGPRLQGKAAEGFLASFNAAVLSVHWRDVEIAEGEYAWAAIDRQIEWCRSHGLRICMGPLITLDARALPDWFYLYEDDYDSMLSAAGQYVEAIVNRYRGKVDLWVASARLNTSQVISLGDEERLRFAAAMTFQIHKLDPNRPLTISIDQPWGEYLARRGSDYSPLQFADALVRARLDLKAIVLEMNLGFSAGSTLPRNEIDISRMLDHWSLLGLPLIIALTVPSDHLPDPHAVRKLKYRPGDWTADMQRDWVARYMPLILAKPAVQGVFWNQLSDALPHEFPHAGLLDEHGQPKAAMEALAAIRSQYLVPKAEA